MDGELKIKLLVQHILHVYRQIAQCTVMGLKLRNQGTAEICETGELDGPGNSWAWGETESYAFIYSRTIVCANFRPRELRKAKLQFKFHFHSSCIDHSATSLSLHIVQLVWKALVHPIK